MFALAQRLFGGFARGDIDDRRQHDCPLVGLDRVQPDLDRELASIPLETVEIATGPDQTRARIGKKRLPQRRMMTTEPFGDEHLHRLSYQVGPRVSKNALGQGVYQDNPARLIDHHHSVRRSFDDQAEAALAG